MGRLGEGGGMTDIEKHGFVGAAAAWDARLDAALERFLPDETGLIAIAGATAHGPTMQKVMVRSGVLILFDGGLELWHRSVLSGLDPAGRYATASTGAAAACALGRRDTIVELSLLDPEGEATLSITVRAGSEMHAIAIERAIQRWLEHEELTPDELAISTLVDAANATAQRVRQRAKGTVDTVTLREFRETIDAAMSQVVEVLAVHEAEISQLRRREQELTAELEALRTKSSA
jgi:hypothetical protein